MAPVDEMTSVARSPQQATTRVGALLRPRTDSVVEEISEGEVVLIDLHTTAAYTLSGPALEIWMTIRNGCHVEDAVQAVANKYSGEADDIRKGVGDLIEVLLDEGLVLWTERLVKTDGGFPAQGKSLPPVEAFETPILTKFEGLAGDLTMMQGYALRFG